MNNLKYFVILFYSVFAYSQVGINTTTPNPSSMLEISSSNKGILIPRVSLTSTIDNTTIASPAISLLVYNLSSTADVTPGFYYWDTVWKPISSGGSSTGGEWKLTGNTIAATDYIGSNNFFPVVLKTNSTQVTRLHPNGGVAIGINAAANDNNSVAIGSNASATASNEALALGRSANASGFRSAAVGNGAISSNNDAIALGFAANASGFRATALGYQSAGSNNDVLALGYQAAASGYQSTAIGSNSISSNNNTVAIGHTANASGLYASAIGYGSNASGQQATAIGFNASTTQADAIVLGNSANANNKVGIGTNTPDERLHVAGSIKIVDGTQGAGKVLTSDANGKASWSAVSAKSYGSAYYNGGGFALGSTTNFPLGASNAAQNVTINSDGITVLNAGVYKISYTINIQRSGVGASTGVFNMYRNGVAIPQTLTRTTVNNTNNNQAVSNTIITNLSANDKISVRISSGDSNISVTTNGYTLNIDSM